VHQVARSEKHQIEEGFVTSGKEKGLLFLPEW